MTHDPSADEIDIAEAMRLTGKTRDTLMRWKRDGKVTARTVETEYTQKQRRILFRREDIERLAEDEAQEARNAATPENEHSVAGE